MGYPYRPDKKRRPKSTHSASRKGRVWLETAIFGNKAGRVEEAKLAADLCVIGHSNDRLQRLLARTRHNRIPVGRRLKPGPRPFVV